MSNTSEITILPYRLEQIVVRLVSDFRERDEGHCVRVDYLPENECYALCRELRIQAKKHQIGLDVFLLGEETEEWTIPVDRAIELRNRKANGLCLFVPATLRDVAVSSLGNSFAPFDVPRFYRSLAITLRTELNPAVYKEVSAVLRATRSITGFESEIAYLSAIREKPTRQTVGQELWRLGLIPDAKADAQDFLRRLELNLNAVNKLARPSRPTMSIADRVKSLSLKTGTLQSRLSQFLLGKQLQYSNDWLERLGLELDLTFDHWEFPPPDKTDLESVTLKPLYTYTGVAKDSGLVQPMPDAVPVAPIGENKFLKVGWETVPRKIANVAQWRLELIPYPEAVSEDDDDEPLMTITASKGARTLKIPLDFQGQTPDQTNVCVRIVALDTSGVEIRRHLPDESVSEERFEDVSLNFYLVEEDIPLAGQTRTLPVDRCLADALLKRALVDKEREPLQPQSSEENDLFYLAFLAGKKNRIRLATTPFLYYLQRHILEAPEQAKTFTQSTDGVTELSIERLGHCPIEVADIETAELWRGFLKVRSEIFKAIGKDVIATKIFDDKMERLAIRQADAYKKVLHKAEEKVAEGVLTRAEFAALLEIDTLHLTFHHFPESPCVHVILPTHPLRLLWFAAYNTWVDMLTTELYTLDLRKRKARIAPENLKILSAGMFPALFVGLQPNDTAVTGNEIDFFHTAALPIGCGDPQTFLRETARAVGYESFVPFRAEKEAKRLQEGIADYLTLHPEVPGLRINVINPGSGGLIRDALERQRDQEALLPVEERRALSFDVIADLPPNGAGVPTSEDTLESFLRRPNDRPSRDALRPTLQVARRKVGFDADGQPKPLPGGEVHLTIVQDLFVPRVVRQRGSTTPIEQNSATLFGLQNRLITHLHREADAEDGQGVWEGLFQFENFKGGEKHPVNAHFTDGLMDLHETILRGMACLLPKGDDVAVPVLPSLQISFGERERKCLETLHERSDWVLTRDRFLGAEIFDAVASDAYLLDYAPEYTEAGGHRMMVTTCWDNEIVSLLRPAARALGLDDDMQSSTQLLSILKTLSGRLALRLIEPSGNGGSSNRAKEAVALAVVAHTLENAKQLQNAIVVPLDAHSTLLRDARANEAVMSERRCDLMIVRPSQKRMRIEFVEVKYRQGSGVVDGLLSTMDQQNVNTQTAITSLYFPDPPRLDTPLLRTQWASILRFYLERARRHRRIDSDAKYRELLRLIARAEVMGTPLETHCTGYVVQLNAPVQKDIISGQTHVHFLTQLNAGSCLRTSTILP